MKKMRQLANDFIISIKFSLMMKNKEDVRRSILRKLYSLQTFFTKRMLYIVAAGFVQLLVLGVVLTLISDHVFHTNVPAIMSFATILMMINVGYKSFRHTRFIRYANTQYSIDTVKGSKLQLGEKSKYLLGASKEARKAWSTLTFHLHSEEASAQMISEVLKENAEAKKSDFIKAAYAKVSSPKAQSTVNPLMACAYHEAGHVVVGDQLGIPVIYVDVRQDSSRAGVTYWGEPDEAYYHVMWKKMIASYAGSFAELLADDNVHNVQGHTVDLAQIQAHANLIWHSNIAIEGVVYNTPFDLMQQARVIAKDLVQNNAQLINRVASELLVKKSLGVSDIVRLLSY